MQFFTGMLINTPWWVWLILAGLTYLGYSRTKTRTSRPFMLVIPAFIIASILVLKLLMAHFAPAFLEAAAAGVLAGFILLAVARPDRGIRRLESGLVEIRGEWFSLCMFLAVFTANYTIAVLTVVAPDQMASGPAIFVPGFVNGLSATFMIGRAIIGIQIGRRAMPLSVSEMGG